MVKILKLETINFKILFRVAYLGLGIIDLLAVSNIHLINHFTLFYINNTKKVLFY